MKRTSRWMVAFGRFWYHFIIGDDWTIAAMVFIGLIATALLNANRLLAWWLVPLIAVVTLGISLRRAAGMRR